LKIHEYQAKELFARYKIPVPSGRVACTAEQARAIACELGRPVAVKAQVHVGGRGKAGGIRLATTAEEAQTAAQAILGMNLKGLTVQRVLVEEACDIAQEYYVGITVDRSARQDVAMVSSVGGVDIEEVSAQTPQKIAKLHLDPLYGLLDFQARLLVGQAGLPGSVGQQAVAILKQLYKLRRDCDASLAEINPLVLTPEGRLVAADAKINVDDNALFRQEELAALREEQEEDPIEAEAHRRGITYVRLLGGDVGVIGNGAGLVMTTLDVVQREGGRPANFLDIGGGAKAELVANALEIVLMDPGVKGVLFNIFGGITRCDEVAHGIRQATSGMSIRVPIVIRLTGTREQEGRKLLEGSALISAESMDSAAREIVKLVRQGHVAPAAVTAERGATASGHSG